MSCPRTGGWGKGKDHKTPAKKFAGPSEGAAGSIAKRSPAPSLLWCVEKRGLGKTPRRSRRRRPYGVKIPALPERFLELPYWLPILDAFRTIDWKKIREELAALKVFGYSEFKSVSL
ncbi:MAG: hypothetical protein COT36_01250 [Parcubacteria group bacterium CG08_land_8_20_14_0_20_38_56]|nr:MAG: hypothetical protein COT36_01250 [Parcubacteria group bacterium CG08_land_8_20_14_0_20_38_56]